MSKVERSASTTSRHHSAKAPDNVEAALRVHAALAGRGEVIDGSWVSKVLTLGESGMGQVYRATNTNLKRQVALKVLPDSVAGEAEGARK